MTTMIGLALAFALIATATPATAGSKVFDVPSTCTTINCNATLITGRIGLDWPYTDPFVIQVLMGGGGGTVAECLRIEVMSGGDLVAVLLPPGGGIYADDDKMFGACPACPLIRAITPPGDPDRVGWATLHIANFGGQRAPGNFTLLYGRYAMVPGQQNCIGAPGFAVMPEIETPK